MPAGYRFCPKAQQRVYHRSAAWNEVPRVTAWSTTSEALRVLRRPVRYLLFCDDGHEITRRENHAVLASTVAEWVRAAFGSNV